MAALRAPSGISLTSFVFSLLLIASVFGGEDTSRVPGPWHTEEHLKWVAGPEVSEEVSMTEDTRAFIGSILTAGQMEKSLEVLSATDAWGSLGPNAPAGPGRPDVPRPEKSVRLDIPDDAEGDGSADDPWRGVLADFFEGFEFEDHEIETYGFYPDAEQLDEYLEALDYDPVMVRLPAGYYSEWALTVPPGVWLAGEGEVTVSPAVPEGEMRGTLVELQIGSGLENVRLDGSNIPGFHFGDEAVPGRLESSPDNPVHGVVMNHGAWVLECEIRNFTHSGIRAAGGRGRRGSHGAVVGNIIENIGYSGISAQSRWLIQDNQMRHCGYLRPTGAGGDDPIIPRWGIETAIINNLVINGRSEIDAMLGRHVISGQSSHRCLVAGNVSIADGSQRNNIQFSDGSHKNRFVGNLTIATGRSSSGIQAGVASNGFGNIIEYNVSILNPQGFRPGAATGFILRIDLDPDDPPQGYFRYNYAEYRSNLLHRMRDTYETKDNEGSRDRRTVLELPNPEDYGFFRSVNHVISGSAIRMQDERFLHVPEDLSLPGEFSPAETVPVIDFVRYPLYDLSEGPGLMSDGLWSHWGKGVVHSNGKVYTAVGNHYSIGSTSYIYEYDPETRTLKEVADVFSAVEGFDPDIHYGFGKIHGRLSEGADGKIYFAGDAGTRKNLHLFKGSHIFSYDPETGKLKDVGRPLFGWNAPSTHMNSKDMLFYAEVHLPERHYGGSFSDSYHDDYRFMVYDIELGRVVYHGSKENSTYGRAFFVDGDGRAYFYNDNDRGPGVLQKYNPDDNSVRNIDLQLPGYRLRRTAGPDAEGFLYGITTDTQVLFRFDPVEEEIEVLHNIGTDTAGMAIDAEGGYIYYVPGTKDTARYGSPLVQLDIETRSQKIIAFLHKPVWKEHGFHLGGTYNVMCAPDGQTVYIAFNGDKSRESFGRQYRFGDQALVAVHIPPEERR